MGVYKFLQDHVGTREGKMLEEENLLRRRKMEQEEERANGLRSRMDQYAAGEFDARPAGLDPSNGITWNQERPEDTVSKQNLMRQIAPEAYWSRQAEAIMPSAPEEYTLTPGAQRRRGAEVIAENPIPTEAPKRRTGQFGNRLIDLDTGDTIREFEQEGEQWSPLTGEMAKSLGLNPTGSYQRNSKGQIQTITQPKQDAPTETQAKYAYNAKRVAGSLAKVNEVLAKDQGASSSWMLDTFGEGPVASRTGADVAARKWVNPNAQIVRNNMVDAIDAVITLGTGAAYTKEQLEAARASYMPRPGEPPNVKQDKFRKLLEVYEQARTNARTAGEDLPDPAAFAGIFGIEEDEPIGMTGRDNDPLGLRGR